MPVDNKVIEIMAAKGGVGQTTFAVNFACSLRKATDKKVALLDLNISGALAVLLNLPKSKSLLEVLPFIAQLNPGLLRGFLQEHLTGIHFISYTADRKKAGQILPAHIEKILTLLKTAYDYTVVNLENSFSTIQLAALDQADLVFLLTTPEILSLYSAARVFSQFTEEYFPQQLIKIILNRSDLSGGMPKQQISGYLKQEVFWELPDDPGSVISSANKGVPLIIQCPASAYKREIFSLVNRLAEESNLEATQNKGLFAEIKRILAKSLSKTRQAAAESAAGPAEPVHFTPQELSEDEVKLKIYNKLLLEIKADATIDLSEVANPVRRIEIERQVRATLEKILSTEGDSITGRLDRVRIAKEILDEALGLGPLEDLLKDPTITEIMVNGKDKIYIERGGKIFKISKTFISNERLMNVIERIVTPLGRRVDESSPLVDARLRDGSRVNAIIPPLALAGPTLTIRKFSKEMFGFDDLIKFGSISKEMVSFLKVCVLLRKNILISGGTGSGKTTLLNVLSGFIPQDERIVTIEDAAELRLPQEHVVALETRPPNIEGAGEITIRRLVINSLRMRPDRIIVGECRGGEAMDMLQAMNTGHDGSLTTIHSNSPRDALSRLETLVLMSGLELPIAAIRDQISSAIDIILQISRFSDGTRKVISITEITGQEEKTITLADLFVFKQAGLGPQGQALGNFMPTGVMPGFIEDIKIHGLDFDLSVFTER